MKQNVHFKILAINPATCTHRQFTRTGAKINRDGEKIITNKLNPNNHL